jgi:hypothetical protein
MPEYLNKAADPQNEEAYGQIYRGDLGVSRLSLGQTMSPQVKEGTVKKGEMFLSETGIIVPPNTPFMILRRERIYYKFKNRNPLSGKGVEFVTKDPMDPRIVKIRGLDFQDDPNEPGKKVAPTVTEFLNHYILLPKTFSTEPVLLSFKRTSLPAGRKLFKKLSRILQDRHVPIYGALFILRQPIIDKYSNYEFNIEFCQYTPEAHLARAKEASVLAKHMADFAMETPDATDLDDAAITAEFHEQEQTAPTPTPTCVQNVPANPGEMAKQSFEGLSGLPNFFEAAPAPSPAQPVPTPTKYSQEPVQQPQQPQGPKPAQQPQQPQGPKPAQQPQQPQPAASDNPFNPEDIPF